LVQISFVVFFPSSLFVQSPLSFATEAFAGTAKLKVAALSVTTESMTPVARAFAEFLGVREADNAGNVIEWSFRSCTHRGMRTVPGIARGSQNLPAVGTVSAESRSPKRWCVRATDPVDHAEWSKGLELLVGLTRSEQTWLRLQH
jgi:hypothetical protein